MTRGWVITTMTTMELIWEVLSIRLIFADTFINPRLLTYLEILNICTLRYEHYHLLNEVWPSENICGEVILVRVLPYLKDTISSSTMD